MTAGVDHPDSTAELRLFQAVPVILKMLFSGALLKTIVTRYSLLQGLCAAAPTTNTPTTARVNVDPLMWGMGRRWGLAVTACPSAERMEGAQLWGSERPYRWPAFEASVTQTVG